MALPSLLSLTEAEIKRLYRQSWTQGHVLRDWLSDRTLFPLELRFKQPAASDWRSQLIEIQALVRELKQLETRSPLQITWDQVRTPVGTQLIPTRIQIQAREKYLAWLNLEKDFKHIDHLASALLADFPALQPWLLKQPLKLLEYHDLTWQRLKTVCHSLCNQPRPGVYLRELDLPGVDTKFIESHQGLLREWLDVLLPPESIESQFTSLSGQGFARRYGLRYDEPQIRFRILDPALRLHPNLSDMAVPVSEFQHLNLFCRRIFICENKTSFLSFPFQPDSLVLFGSGKAVELLAAADWLKQVELVYWGDLDTHGFAILASLRRTFTRLRSILMDLPTLLAHRSEWGEEPNPTTVNLESLSESEQLACQALLSHELKQNLRLEQEKISQSYLLKTLQQLQTITAGYFGSL